MDHLLGQPFVLASLLPVAPASSPSVGAAEVRQDLLFPVGEAVSVHQPGPDVASLVAARDTHGADRTDGVDRVLEPSRTPGRQAAEDEPVPRTVVVSVATAFLLPMSRRRRGALVPQKPRHADLILNFYSAT